MSTPDQPAAPPEGWVYIEHPEVGRSENPVERSSLPTWIRAGWTEVTQQPTATAPEAGSTAPTPAAPTAPAPGGVPAAPTPNVPVSNVPLPTAPATSTEPKE
jgi:hypothetical protein